MKLKQFLFLTLTLGILAISSPLAPIPTNADALLQTGLQNATSAPAPAKDSGAPTDFNTFVASVSNGSKDVTGVYVPGVLALRVVRQSGNSISAAPGVATLYQAAAQRGVIGLLAHNYVSGWRFFNLSPGMEVRIVYGNGTVKKFTVSSIQRYQATAPGDFSKPLINLSTGREEKPKSIFNKIYSGGNKVVFQTCIAQDGYSSWGLIFVTAKP